MARVDVEWPSEDEDFDATTSDVGANKSSKTATAERPVETEVAPADEAAHEAEVPKVETPAQVAPEASEEPESTAETETETESVAPAAEAAADPVPAAADQPPTKTKADKMSSDAPKKTNKMIRMAGEAVLLIAVIALALVAWNLSASNKNLKTQVASLNANPQVAIQKQTSALIAQVGKLINLPSGETPTIAAVTDAAQAKKQSAFFNSAENGDKVLMYVKAGEAILYRPSTNKIILVAPLTFTSNGNTATTPTPTKK